MDLLLLITTITVTKYNTGVQGVTPELYPTTSTPDFATIANLPAFVDKSSLIKVFFEATSPILITTPPGYGKTTNLHMIKRFCELQVDDKGVPKDIETTANYKLFMKKRLTITNDQPTFKEHFGKHPVVFVDYTPFKNLTSFEGMRRILKTIISGVYEQHAYLLESDKLGRADKTYVKEFIDPARSELMDDCDINSGLTKLMFYLQLHFDKKAVVLIDGYDAYRDSLLFVDNIEVEKIIDYIERFSHNLLKSNDYIYRAMLVGLFRITTSDSVASRLTNVIHYRWLHDHQFTTYYGLIESEVDDLLERFIINSKIRQKVKGIAQAYYNGYGVLKQNFNIYSWSLLRYLQNETDTKDRRCCRTDYLKRFMSLLSVPEITSRLQRLVLGGDKILDIVQGRLTTSDIISLREMKTSQQYVLPANKVDLFFYFLYENGHLAVSPETFHFGMQVGVAKLPNLKIVLVFSRVLKDIYTLKYNIDRSRVDSLGVALNSLSETTLNEISFTGVHRSLDALLKGSNFTPKTKDDFLGLLFVLLKTEFPSADNNVRSLNLHDDVKNEHTSFTFINDRGVTVVMVTDIVRREEDKTATCDTAAKNAHQKLVDKNYISCLDKDSRNRLVYLASCYDVNNRTVRLAYSYQYDEIGDLRNTRIVS